MVDPLEDDDAGGLDFDKLAQDEEVYLNQVRDRQGSVHASKLSKDETPDFIKQM